MQEQTSRALASTYPLSLVDPGAPSSVSRVQLNRSGEHASASSRGLDELVAQSSSMSAILTLLGKLAPTEVTLTLVGETGTGKDVLATAIHASSAQASGPFVVFDCGAVSPNLAESELFGHERGSFTGAMATHAGAFERAHGGTLFLDEIGELPLDLQPRLLRVLEGRRVRRVGGTQDRTVDVRVIAATNRDLPAEVCAGRFRQDLFFRLAGAVVPVPPVRDRLEDLPVLVTRLLQDLARPDVTVADDAFDAMKGHTWPGNVRELKNTLACALAFLDGHAIERHHLRIATRSSDAPTLEQLPLGGMTLHHIERAAIKQTLAQMGGNKSHTARVLGIAVSTLYEKLKKHSL